MREIVDRPDFFSRVQRTLRWELIITTTTGGTTCVSTRALSGTLTITLDPPQSGGTVTGKAQQAGTMTETAVTNSARCSAQPGSLSLAIFYPVTGTTANLTYRGESTSTAPNGLGSVTCTELRTFSGALAAGAVSGTMTHSRSCQGTSSDGGTPVNGNGSVTMPVTLR